MSQQTTTPKTRRNRLAPYTAAERRLKKMVVADDDPISQRHLARGLSRRYHGQKYQ